MKFTINNPYANGGPLKLKGQTHCHTTNSNGTDTPLALVKAYKNAEYQFITITDHDVMAPDLSAAGITCIGTACEETQERHINAYDISVMMKSIRMRRTLSVSIVVVTN